MPAARLSSGEAKCVALPSTRISPSLGRRSPARICMSVDLPAPFSPTTAWISPARKPTWTRSSARTPGNLLVTPAISMICGLNVTGGRFGGRLFLDDLVDVFFRIDADARIDALDRLAVQELH